MSQESILIVDDNVDNLELTKVLLECEGFEVRLAEDAAQALDRLAAYRPDLILMDVQMPGMDGLELTRKLRRDPRLRDVIIVALTAYAMKSDEDAARAAGCDGYITKPINTRTFPTAVRAYLNPAVVEKRPRV
jgi:CheY-like chemotaxis protein